MDSLAPPYPQPPGIPTQACPVATTLRSFGRKWTLTILRDIAFFPKANFGLIRKRNHGLRQRTLSNRLRELIEEDLIRRVVPPDEPRRPYYELTETGREVWPILAALFQFGIRNHAGTVFADGRRRTLTEMFPRDAELMLGTLVPFARTIHDVPAAPPSGSTARQPPDRPSRR